MDLPGKAGTSRTYSWQYDSLYRLRDETITGFGSVSYELDAVGNRTNRTSSIGSLPNQSFSYTANDWLTSDSYDSNGNTTGSEGRTLAYDPFNRLTNFNDSVFFGYDGDGNRITKTADGVTTYFLIDDQNPTGYAQVLEEQQASGGTTNLLHVHNYGLALISQRDTSGQTYYFVSDGHGSTRMLVEQNGNVANVFTYDTFGNLIASNAPPQTAYLYCGEYFDSHLLGYYLRARVDIPQTGRFLTRDSREGSGAEPLSLHRYLYCHSNPVNGVDPSGHLVEQPLMAGGYQTKLQASYGGTVLAGNATALKTIAWTVAIHAWLAMNFMDVGEVRTETDLPQIPDQGQQKYKELQDPALDFGKYGRCVEYAEKVSARKSKDRPLFIGYRLRPGYNTETGGYSPWGNIMSRLSGQTIAINGFHVGAVLSGNVFDNYYSGIPLMTWPLLYEVIHPKSASDATVTLMRAHGEGFGELKLFRDAPPRSRYDPRWGSVGTDIINVPTME